MTDAQKMLELADDIYNAQSVELTFFEPLKNNSVRRNLSDTEQRTVAVALRAASTPLPGTEMREALEAVADFMRKDVQNGDFLLWTPEYEALHDQIIVALALSPAGQTGTGE